MSYCSFDRLTSSKQTTVSKKIMEYYDFNCKKAKPQVNIHNEMCLNKIY